MDTITVEPRNCFWCGNTAQIDVPFEGFVLWNNGKLIQEALPELSSDERELLMTGTHSDCWEAAYGIDE